MEDPNKSKDDQIEALKKEVDILKKVAEVNKSIWTTQRDFNFQVTSNFKILTQDFVQALEIIVKQRGVSPEAKIDIMTSEINAYITNVRGSVLKLHPIEKLIEGFESA